MPRPAAPDDVAGPGDFAPGSPVNAGRQGCDETPGSRSKPVPGGLGAGEGRTPTNAPAGGTRSFIRQVTFQAVKMFCRML